MTERFSPEYIAFILSDEASVLQEELRFEYGAEVIITSTEPINELGVLIEREFGGDQWRIFVPRVSKTAWWVTSSLLRLPSLTDLLGMIEEAGWKVGFDNTEAGYSFCAYKAGKPFQRLMLFSQESDIDHAAAKLAVRVLEEKEND